MPLENDEFAAVFDSLMDKGEAPDETTAPPDQASSSDLPENDAQQSGEPGDGAGAAAEPTESGDDAADAGDEGVSNDADGQSDAGDQGTQGVDWQAQFEALRSELEALKNPKPAAPEPAPSEPPALYTPEETTELTYLQEQWPDAKRLFELMARQLQFNTLDYAFKEVGKVLTPLQETVGAYTLNDHSAAIYEAHPDYDEAYAPAMKWIETQPSFLKAAYQNVVKQGTAEEVNMMMQRFKDETKWVAPSAPAPKAPAPNQKQTVLSEAAKQAAKAMGAVGGKRGAVAGAQDPNDFDGAWEEALSTK